MTKEELNNREVIWEALSKLYVDNELDSEDYDCISNILVESNIEYSELQAIDLYEVFPSLQANLSSPAGEWAGFNKNWLSNECRNNYKSRKNSVVFRRRVEIKNKFYYWMRKKHWNEIKSRMKPSSDETFS